MAVGVTVDVDDVSGRRRTPGAARPASGVFACRVRASESETADRLGVLARRDRYRANSRLRWKWAWSGSWSGRWRSRAREQDDGQPDLRTSTMTHVVWAPPRWLPKARAVFAGLDERHPARTIFLVPEGGRRTHVRGSASLKQTPVIGLSREVFAEVIELRLAGVALRHPASLVLPLLISDLPVAQRWRGEPPWSSSQLAEIVDVCDRLVVDSSEWPGLPARYRKLSGLFDRVAVSDLAFARSLPWRVSLAELWPEIARVERLRVEGPRAESLPTRRLAPLAPGAGGTADAPRRARPARGVDRRRAGRSTCQRRAHAERAPLGRARRARPRPGVRGRRPGGVELGARGRAGLALNPNCVLHM